MKIKLDRNLRWVFLLSALIATTACGLVPSKSDPATTNKNSSSSSASAFSPSNDPQKDLRDSIQKLSTAYPYRLTETLSSTPNSQTSLPGGTRVVEFAAADRTRMKTNSAVGGNIEAITIGDKHYFYNGSKWTEGSLPSTGDANSDLAKKVAEIIKDVKYVGPESVNGVACHLYTCIYDGSTGGQKWTGTGKFWIRAADGLIQQSDSDFKIGTFGGHSHIAYEYNVDIKVEKPAM